MFLKALLIVCVSLSLVHGFEDKTISQWLTDNGYNTLVSLLKQAGLYSTLDSPGAFTLFAPSEAAFGKLPQSTVNAVTSDTATLQSVLKYHVLSGFAMAPTIHDGDKKPTLNGQDLTFKKFPNGTILVDNAVVSASTNDIILNNGVVHVINSVLLPNTDKVGEILLKRNQEFSTLNMLLTITDLEPALLSGDVTLFAPTNAAFNAITTRLPDFSDNGALDVYKQILLNHVVNGTVLSSDLKNGQVVTTLSGRTLKVTIDSNGVSLTPTGTSTSGKVTEADVTAVNGAIHVVDQVLIPSGVRRKRRAVRRHV
ncbi:periostin-like [Mercenaria mercenaria]|uniref:periostin-like n=1 Tax=Mercenaria mercenaria TaxID=6596 RepID=UPI00234F232C|nr:periostin-like [Mercenaria mercenaria]